jgi:hypothetical protein
MEKLAIWKNLLEKVFGWRTTKMSSGIKILDPYAAPLARYSDILEELAFKPFEDGGSVSSAPIVMQVGGLLQTFEKLQDELILLHTFLNRGQVDERELQSFSRNIAFCKRIAHQSLNDDRKEEALKKWLGACLKAAEIRNKVAHGQAINIHYVGKGGPTRGVFLAASIERPQKGKRPLRPTRGPYCWNVAQLQGYRATFTQLYEMMMTVREQLEGSSDESLPEVLDPDRM